MKPRILFVEDEPDFFAPFIEAVNEDYDLTEVYDLTEAVEILCREEFACLLVDIMLTIGDRDFPDVDSRRSGLYLIRLIRGEEQHPEIKLKCPSDVPILVLTAVSDLSLEGKLEALDAPMVPKPFSMTQVLDQIAAMLKERARGA